MKPGGVPQWPCSIRTSATRRLLVAASIKRFSLMTGTPSRVQRDGGLKCARRKGDGPAPSNSERSASSSSAPSGYRAGMPPQCMARPSSAEDPSRRDLESQLATDPARPAGLPEPSAPLLYAPAGSAIWTSLPPPAILALYFPSAPRVER